MTDNITKIPMTYTSNTISSGYSGYSYTNNTTSWISCGGVYTNSRAGSYVTTVDYNISTKKRKLLL